MSVLTKTPKYGALSAGGVPACLMTSGAIAALELFGPASSFNRICCSSGSVAPGILWAAGKSPKWIIGKMIEYDFDRLFPRIERKSTVLKHVLQCEITGKPITMGLRDTAPFGYRMAKHVPMVPLNFMTLSTVGESDIVFDSEGVYEYAPGQVRHILQSTPAPVDVQVRATVTIPVMMQPLTWKDRVHMDGALNHHTKCPTSLLSIHCGAKPDETFALLSGQDTENTMLERLKMRIGRHLARNSQEVIAQQAALTIKPVSRFIRNLDLALPAWRKEEAVLEGFHATLRAQNEANYLDRIDATKIISSVRTINDLYEWLDKRENNSGSLCV